jgi:glutathione reductase (NADPH)
MADYDFDLITLGAGSGGVAASRRAGSYGARVAICERVRVGGTCVLRGCVPKKLLVYGSHFREEFEDARGYGWSIGETQLNWGQLVAQKNCELDRLNGVYVRLLRDSGVNILVGSASLIDAHTVRVGDQTYTSRYILIATGGRPRPADIRGAELAITSDEALELSTVPDHVVIVGGGYIGCEFAGIFNAAGARVTMLIRGDAVLRGFDDDVRAALTTEMRQKGIDIRGDCVVRDLERRDGRISVLTHGGETLDAHTVMYAIGRIPNTEGLGLEQVGIELAPDGSIPVDAYSQTKVSNVYAVGDCTNRVNLTPVAIAEGRAVAEALFNNNRVAMDYHNIPSAVFSQPPASTVGLTERAARQKFGELDVYVTSFRPMKHTISGREERTMMKLVVDRASQKVVGCHMVGADAPEIIQGLAIALQCGATKAQFDSTIGIHPSAAEEFVTMRQRRPDPPADLGTE